MASPKKVRKCSWDEYNCRNRKNSHSYVSDIKTKISENYRKGKLGIVKKLKQELLNSPESKLWNTYKITEGNEERKTGEFKMLTKEEGIHRETELAKNRRNMKKKSTKIKLLEKINIWSKTKYSPSPSLRVYIPKPGTNIMRPLGVPATIYRIAQSMVLDTFEPIVEQNSPERSYGFRKERSCIQAIN